uniref:G-protein coupled receptors family 1 profile domain-containing protein n=1 Tax=Electrophorus electricus TaxID=8005 RepID=A0AAY5EQI9_ELEEL
LAHVDSAKETDLLCNNNKSNTSCSVNLITLISNLSYSDLIVFVFVATLSVLTASGNMVVIVVFSVFKQFHTPANLIVLSLALSDFLIGAIVMPLEIVLLLDTCLHHMKSLCPVYHFISTIVGTVSLYHVVLIAVDRCFDLVWMLCSSAPDGSSINRPCEG